MKQIKLVPILQNVMNRRFEFAMKFFFGLQGLFPILIVTRKQLYNFAFDFCDHSVYETHKEYQGIHIALDERDALIGDLKEALQFYADRSHIVQQGGAHYTQDGNPCPNYFEPENPSGEPLNYLEGHGDYGFEDGSIAKHALDKIKKVYEQ